MDEARPPAAIGWAWSVPAVLLPAILLAGTVALADVTAGAAKKSITPKAPGQYLAGLDANRRATGVHDEIYARCLAISDGNTTIAIVCLDLIGLLPTQVEAIRAKVPDIPASNVIVACTHVHSAPDTIGMWGLPGKSGADPEYIKHVESQTAAAVKDALGAMKPARLRLARAPAPPRTSVNIRDQALIDRDISVLQALDEEGNGIGTLVNWACHPETLWNDNTLVTADFPASLCRTVEEAGGGMAVFANGALGGMVTVDVGDQHTFAEAERIGAAVGQAVVEALEEADALDDLTIRLTASDVTLPIENPLFQIAAKLGVIPLPAHEEVVTRVTTIGLGPAQLVTVPGEALPAVGAAIKGLMPGPHKFLIGLSPIELGYILPEDGYNDELYKYERRMSVGPRTAPLLMETIRNLLRQL
ncbi:MAG: hypothetical protein ACE5JM_05605 [Armatimonadota bacterium]